MDSEVDVIQHLLEVEKEASLMLKDAQKSADQKISKAKSDADEVFKSKYSDAILNIEKDEERQKENLDSEEKKMFADYCKSLETKEKDKKAFVSCLKKLLDA